jgi:hypothetical protein
MKLDQAKRLLDRFLTDLTASIGFSRTEPCRYERQSHDATGPCRPLAPGSGAFTVLVGLRFESLATWLDDDPSENAPTFVIPIHFPRHEKGYTEWEFSRLEDLERWRGSILDDLRTNALPFVEQYSQLTVLRKTLESSNKKDWISIGFSVDTRVTTLATIQFVEGNKVVAKQTLDDALKQLHEALAGRPYELRKRCFEIEYLRKRLFPIG